MSTVAARAAVVHKVAASPPGRWVEPAAAREAAAQNVAWPDRKTRRPRARFGTPLGGRGLPPCPRGAATAEAVATGVAPAVPAAATPQPTAAGPQPLGAETPLEWREGGAPGLCYVTGSACTLRCSQQKTQSRIAAYGTYVDVWERKSAGKQCGPTKVMACNREINRGIRVSTNTEAYPEPNQGACTPQTAGAKLHPPGKDNRPHTCPYTEADR